MASPTTTARPQVLPLLLLPLPAPHGKVAPIQIPTQAPLRRAPRWWMGHSPLLLQLRPLLPRPLLLRPMLPCCRLLRTSSCPNSSCRCLGRCMLFQDEVGGELGWQEVRDRRHRLWSKPSSPPHESVANRVAAFRRRVHGRCFRFLEPVTALPAALAASDAWHATVLATASMNAGSIGKLLLLRLHRHTRTLALRPSCVALLAMAARPQLLHFV
jgi:hypothetical protein